MLSNKWSTNAPASIWVNVCPHTCMWWHTRARKASVLIPLWTFSIRENLKCKINTEALGVLGCCCPLFASNFWEITGSNVLCVALLWSMLQRRPWFWGSVRLYIQFVNVNSLMSSICFWRLNFQLSVSMLLWDRKKMPFTETSVRS